MYVYLIRFVLDNQVLEMIVACFISLAPGENSVQWWSSITPKLIVESGVNYTEANPCVGGEITGIALLPMFVFRLQRNALISPLHHCGLWFYVGHEKKDGLEFPWAIKWNFVIRKLMSKTKSKHWRDWKYQCPIFLNFQT